jgi:hypothetical protein
MWKAILYFVILTVASAQLFHKVELSDEKTPYDYVQEKLDSMSTDAKSGMPLSGSYEVEESEDYPEQLEGAATSVLNTGVNVGAIGGLGGIGLGQGLGIGGLGVGNIGLGQGLGQGFGLGLGGVGVNGVGLGTGIGHGVVANGVGLINPAIAGLGVGGIGLGNGIGNGLIYHPILGGQVSSGYVDKQAYDAAQKKGADQNIEKIEKKAEEESKHGQEGYQQAAAAAKAEKGESSFYKDEEAKKKAAGDEKYYEGGQKFDKHGMIIMFTFRITYIICFYTYYIHYYLIYYITCTL